MLRLPGAGRQPIHRNGDSDTIAARSAIQPNRQNNSAPPGSAFSVTSIGEKTWAPSAVESAGFWTKCAKLPVIRALAKPLYRRRFRAHRRGNAYFGAYSSFAEAMHDIPQGKPADYNTQAAADLYNHRLQHVEASDYPALFWLKHFLDDGARRIFDLGGHVGLSYYAFARLVEYPRDLRWQVHDMPLVMQKGRQLADVRGAASALEFVERDQASGCDVLMAKGVLQYLDYELAGFLVGLDALPQRLLINLTPMHPQQTCFTLQNIGVAVCPLPDQWRTAIHRRPRGAGLSPGGTLGAS
jgi:putative methyltransferase (TIGR04325 family)